MLWPPQEQALHAIQQVYQQPAIPQPQIIQIPTGCGKSTVISLLPRYLFSYAQRLEKEKVVLVIVPSVALVEQTIHAIERSYQRHPEENESIVCTQVLSIKHLYQLLQDREDTVYVPPTFHFWVTNIHKLAVKTLSVQHRQRIADGIDVVAIDEAHHMPASSWQSFLLDPHSIGSRIQRQVLFTATPFRTDKQPLRGALCYLYPYRAAIAAKLIKHPLIHLLQSATHLNRTQRFIKLLERTRLIHEREGGQIIGYAQNIEEAEHIVELCQLHTPSLRAGIWHSKMSKEDQQAVREQFEKEPYQLDFLVQVKKCSEGYDHPPVNIVTFFKSVRSPLSFMQALGRATRQSESRVFAHIVGDDFKRHAFQRLWQHFKLHADDSKLDDFHEVILTTPTTSSTLPTSFLPPTPPPTPLLPLPPSATPSSLPLSLSPSVEEITPPFWWVDPFDATLLPSSHIVPFSESDDDDDNGDDPLTPQDLEQLSQLSIQTDPPFHLQNAGYQVIEQPQRTAPSNLSLTTLTSQDIGLVRLPHPHQKFAIAFASYDCTPPWAREVSPITLLSLFTPLTEPQIEKLLQTKNRNGKKPYISDRFYAYYYSLDKRPPEPPPKRSRTRQYSMDEALSLIESKEKALLQAKQSLADLRIAQEKFDHAFTLIS